MENEVEHVTSSYQLNDFIRKCMKIIKHGYRNDALFNLEYIANTYISILLP